MIKSNINSKIIFKFNKIIIEIKKKKKKNGISKKIK
jgi:hypothetical protein